MLNQKQSPDYLLLDKLVPEKHFLRKINDCVDLSFINQITEPCYSLNKMGAHQLHQSCIFE